MTNTAKILNFGRGNFAGQERNVADLDDGYARLSNMLLEAYSGADLTKRQFKVLLAILRKTYGWNKPMDRITDSQLLAFRENGITTMEQVNAGMRVARRQNRPFLPSPGQFVAWCREEASVTAGLPNVSELVDMVYEYCRKRGLYPDAESYPWKSNAHYWLVTNLYQNMRANALTDAELRRKAADELVHMTARINRGEAIPEPVKQLPVMGGRPLNRAQALAKIAEIKAKFGLKGASV